MDYALAMVWQHYDGDGGENKGPGVRRIVRLTAYYGGHTHIYQYPLELADEARFRVRHDVEWGKLHPYVGIALIASMAGGPDGD